MSHQNLAGRYSVIRQKYPREMIMLRGTGCSWKKCAFCDYHLDFSTNTKENFLLNREVLSKVTGCYGVLEVDNCGSFTELDSATMKELMRVCVEKKIKNVHFECHWNNRDKIADLKKSFSDLGITVKVKCGAETFDLNFREKVMNKGMGPDTDVQDLVRYFDECILLFGLKGQTKESMLFDIETGLSNFERIYVNVMCDNSAPLKPDPEAVEVFYKEVLPVLEPEPRADVFTDNLDFSQEEITIL
ncbi:MAG: hypothetical protein MJ182_00440 [Treponema sp.]|nr:hypothetical protein [Treponema sp.]